MSNNVDVGGVPTKTLDKDGWHVQNYIPLEADAPSVVAVPANSATVTLALALGAPVQRRKVMVTNAANTFLYVKAGTGASLTSYTIPVAPQGSIELVEPIDSGIITGIWALQADGSEPVGSAMVTQWTSTGAV